MKLKVNDKIKVPNERQRYTVQARDDRFIIATKPCNIHHTVLYFIIDLECKMRGPDNMIFCSGYETREQCEERLKELQEGQIEVSSRHGIELDLDVE